MHRHSSMGPSCHSGTPNLVLMVLPGSLWDLTNGSPPAGGTPAGGKAPRPHWQGLPGTPSSPSTPTLRSPGSDPQEGTGQDGPTTAFQAQPGRFRGWE